MPRKKAAAPIPLTMNTSQNEIVPLEQTEPPPQPPVAPASGKAKREKKSSKHKVVAVVTPDGIQGSFQTEPKRPLIAHLPIHSADIVFHDQPLVYDPKPPGNFEAYNAGEIDPFASEATYTYEPVGSGKVGDSEEVEEKCAETPEELKPVSESHDYAAAPSAAASGSASAAVASSAPYRKEFGPTTLLVEFAGSRQSQHLPDQTDVNCFWCCEGFASRPCVIPIKIVDSVWHVYGNFCNPQCAMAYLLSEILDTHTRWERIALLNRLYNENVLTRIYPAPARETLVRFGGPIRIEEYRAMCDAQRTRVDIQMPPMVSILASMDTKPIDFYETSLRNNFSTSSALPARPTYTEDQPLKLRRTKPLKDKESTLDNHLGIKIRG